MSVSLLTSLLKADESCMRILKLVANLGLPDCFVAAGFVRNKVWDHIHGSDTLLNDVDVIFYQQGDSTGRIEQEAQKKLHQIAADVNWQVKNQAYIHKRNGDPEYSGIRDALTYWPEKETAVAVRLLEGGILEIIAPFGVMTLFSGKISHNPKRDKAIFLARLDKKQWLKIWPKLEVIA